MPNLLLRAGVWGAWAEAKPPGLAPGAQQVELCEQGLLLALPGAPRPPPGAGGWRWGELGVGGWGAGKPLRGGAAPTARFTSSSLRSQPFSRVIK